MMKKTLVALAAAAATGAFAQVNITGNIDLGIRNVSAQDPTKNSTNLAKNNASTSTLGFSGSEDLGGGLKAGFKLEWTVTPEASGSENAAGQTLAAANSQYFTGTPFNSEQFLSLSGNWGTIKAGEPNAAVYRAQFETQPLGTALGSGYSGTVSRMGYQGGYGLSSYMGNTPGAQNSLRVIRVQKTVQYETPVMNGLSAMVETGFGNNNDTSKFTSNSPNFMGLMLNYASGPVKLTAAVNTYSTGLNGVAGNANGFSVTKVALASGENVTYQILGGNYTLGQNTFYAGYTNVRASDATEDSQSWNVAYKFAMSSNIDIMANLVSTSSSLPSGGVLTFQGGAATTSTQNLNKKIIGLGADYRLSKRTNLYVRYENYDQYTDCISAGEQISTAFGVRHQF